MWSLSRLKPILKIHTVEVFKGKWTIFTYSFGCTGNGFSQPIALATLSPELTHKLKDDNFKNELTQQLTKFLEATNATLEQHERLDCLVLLPEAWSVENGLLTPTLKIRRNEIEGKYLGDADLWLAQKQLVIWA
jgi:long-chain acyl-CoA synthetase